MIQELYDGRVKVKFTEGNHAYTVLEPSDRYGPKGGVTTAINYLHKDGLTQWAANKAVDVFKEAYSQLPTMGEEEFDELCKQAKNLHTQSKYESADIGKQVHEWIENHIKGHDGEISELMQPSIDAFLSWEEAHDPEYIDSERLVYSWEYDYCGQVDLVAKINGKRLTLDFKTGKPDWEYNSYKKRFTGNKRARSTHLIQSGGYDQAILEEDGIESDAYGAVYLPLDGSCHYFINDQTAFWRQAFLSVLDTARFIKKANYVINPYERETNG